MGQMTQIAIISSTNSAEVFNTEPRAEEDDFVQGSLVIGLTEANIRSLDYFEGGVSVFLFLVPLMFTIPDHNFSSIGEKP